MNPAPQWVLEREASELLAIKHSTLRTMRRDGRLEPGVHYIFSTGTAGGPVAYDVAAIREHLAQLTVAMVTEENKRRTEALKQRRAAVESFTPEGLDQLVAEVQS